MMIAARDSAGATDQGCFWSVPARTTHGSLKARYTHGHARNPDIGTVVEVERIAGGATYFQYLHMDHRGTVYKVTDAAENTQIEYTLDSFGRELSAPGGGDPAVPNDLVVQTNGLTLTIGGKRYLVLKYRLIPLDEAAFLSRDFLDYPNPYRAWGNNPVGQLDRDGLEPEPEVIDPVKLREEIRQRLRKIKKQKPSPIPIVGVIDVRMIFELCPELKDADIEKFAASKLQSLIGKVIAEIKKRKEAFWEKIDLGFGVKVPPRDPIKSFTDRVLNKLGKAARQAERDFNDPLRTPPHGPTLPRPGETESKKDDDLLRDAVTDAARSVLKDWWDNELKKDTQTFLKKNPQLKIGFIAGLAAFVLTRGSGFGPLKEVKAKVPFKLPGGLKAQFSKTMGDDNEFKISIKKEKKFRGLKIELKFEYKIPTQQNEFDIPKFRPRKDEMQFKFKVRKQF